MGVMVKTKLIPCNVGAAALAVAPDPEVPPRARRRSFTAEYRMAILREADACKQPGEVGALLRREGLYSSHISEWRKQREQGMLNTKRGRRPGSRADVEVARLSREVARLQRELRMARTVIEVQGKVSALLKEMSVESAGETPGR
jgi:transposase-like protein